MVLSPFVIKKTARPAANLDTWTPDRHGHGALVIHRSAVAGDIITVTAAADIQIAVLESSFPLLLLDFRASGILPSTLVLLSRCYSPCRRHR